MVYRTVPSGPALRLGRLLSQCRRRDRLTQAAASRAVGVALPTLAGWEQGRRLPDAANLLRLLRLYRIEPEQADRVLAGEAHVPGGG